eukprot:gnl/MRDRNA2_/MRDRNA2_77769_c0_seq1.p1 gnl/MRDRNA2_/MRDRNA2_77769_c0~~gnl/MRDRNA2_/MRDRNA2_77769_c0_seq1.p1  ORF type:complete len:873 (+),score=124.35 gnl/MRDRNA2_/MRDRNA2_77769_c0_seq1:393-2621(+)
MKTAIGFLVAAAARRKAKSANPIAILSCDNVQSNGDKLSRCVLEFSKVAGGPELQAYIEENWTFPNSMVDRITPGTTPALIDELHSTHNIEDKWPVVCEDWIQWVIEEKFPSGRPPWDKVLGGSCLVVKDVIPYELTKLRLLNGSHYAIGFSGVICGYREVHQAIADPDVHDYLKAYEDAVTQAVPDVPGMDITAYKIQTRNRLSNIHVKDQLLRLTAEGRDRLSVSCIPCIQDLSPGAMVPVAALVCCWIKYLADPKDENGLEFSLSEFGGDIAMTELRPIAVQIWTSCDGVSSLMVQFLSRAFAEFSQDQSKLRIFADKCLWLLQLQKVEGTRTMLKHASSHFMSAVNCSLIRSSGESLTFFVGTCFANPKPQTILRVCLSTADGKLALDGPPTKTKGCNPGYLEWRPPSPFMYCGHEDDPGSVQAYRLTWQNGVKRDSEGSIKSTSNCTLEPWGAQVSSVGHAPCYLSLDQSGRWLFVANYCEGSVAVLPVLHDGSLGSATDSRMHQGGTKINPELADRQEASHPHCIIVHPSNKWVAVADLGLSSVFIYGFNAAHGSLLGAADDPRHLRLKPDAGCRHIVWNEVGDVLFVNNELDCTVTVASFDNTSGALREKSTLFTLPVSVKPLRAHHRGNSHIALHPNGKYLYLGCRSSDPGLIAVFKVHSESSDISLIQHESTRGLVPRNFEIVGEGRWLIVGNQETFNIVSFAIHPESGTLSFASELKTSPHKPCNISAATFT